MKKLCHSRTRYFPLLKFDLKMKLTILFLFVSFFGLQANTSYSQKTVTLNFEEITVSQLLNIIESRTDFLFVYKIRDVDGNRIVKIKAKEEKISAVLDKIFRNTDTGYKIFDNQIFLSKKDKTALKTMGSSIPIQQTVTVTGTITEEDTGMPIPGANILENGTTNGVMTDFDGNYSIEVPEDATIEVSYVGFVKQQIKVGGRSEIDIAMKKETSALDEVVVTALGIRKQEASLGYSVQEVKGVNFEKVKTDQFLDGLNGKVAGLRVNSRSGLLQDPKITLRGREPLYVVNGSPVRNSFRGISPDDIESVTVLKGPQASVLYGSQGTDGAIVITTKSSGGKELELTVNSSTSIAAGFLVIPETQNTYGQGEFGQYAFVDGKGAGLYDDLWVWGPKLDQKDSTTDSGYWETPQYNSPIDPVTGDRTATPWRSHPDNLTNILQRGLITNNNVSVSQNFGKGEFNIGLNQMYRKGMIPNTNVNQLGLNMGGSYDITSKLKFSANVNYSNLFTRNYPPVGYGNDQVYYNTVLYMGANNDINDLRDYWVEGQEGYQQYNYNYAWFQNPWFLANEYLRPYSKKRVIASASLDYDISANTNLIFRVGNDYQDTNNEFKKPYAWVNGETGSYRKETYNENVLDVNAIITSNQKFGDFGLDLMGGFNWNEIESNTFKGSTVGGLIFPDVYNFSNSKKQSEVSNWVTQKRTFGMYGSGTFSWKEALYLSFTGRNDWSSALVKGNRSYFYPSVSASALISRLVDLPKVISFLKLRGSWASVGRDMDAYNLTNYYYLSRVWGNNPSFGLEDRKIDPDIEPSRTDSYELGFDLRLFDNRLRLDMAYFNTLDKNWIQEVNIPVPSGYSKMLTNGNSYLRDGYEVTISGKPILSNDFKWEVSANMYKFKTVLYSIYNDKSKYGNLKVGDRSDAFYADVYLKQPGTNNFIVDNNGLPKYDNFKRDIGNKDPKIEVGLHNKFTYKNFMLDFQVTSRFGGLIYSELNARMIETGKDPRTAIPAREEDWDKKASYVPSNAVKVTSGEVEYNAQGDIVNDTREYAPSDTPVMFKDWMRRMGSLGGRMNKGYNVYNATFVKLRSASLTYDLKDFLQESSIVKAAEVSLIGQNLLIWKKLPNEDPDGDFSSLGYPTERYLGVNFSVTF